MLTTSWRSAKGVSTICGCDHTPPWASKPAIPYLYEKFST
jgi:hypothetical protein